jgi:hypothetical protein
MSYNDIITQIDIVLFYHEFHVFLFTAVHKIHVILYII